jgi:hypothetical protein
VIENQDAFLRAGVFDHHAHQPFQQVAEVELARQRLRGTHGHDEVLADGVRQRVSAKCSAHALFPC